MKMKKVLSMMLALNLFLVCNIPTFAAPSYISEKEAQKIALTYTGVDAADGTVLTNGGDTKNDDKHSPSTTGSAGHPEYSDKLLDAEGSALAQLGITHEDAKYINSYIKYNTDHVAYMICVEIGIYDTAVSEKTIVYNFTFDMNGEAIEQPAPADPDVPSGPAAPVEPVEPEPAAPSTPSPTVPAESTVPSKPTAPEKTKQPDTAKQSKKKVSTKSIKVNKTKVTLKKGQKFTIKVTRNPVSATDKITYSTNKKKVATVSQKGIITARSKGSCKITVKCNGKKKVIRVTVK